MTKHSSDTFSLQRVDNQKSSLSSTPTCGNLKRTSRIFEPSGWNIVVIGFSLSIPSLEQRSTPSKPYIFPSPEAFPLSSMEAFVRSPFSLSSFRRSGPSTCPKPLSNSHLRTVPTARSLDSYREGRRFPNQDSSRKASFSEQSSPPVKQKMSLLKALMKLNVASSETCELLIRSGRVRVNGETVTEYKTRIDGFEDALWISGTDYGTVHDGQPVTFSDSDLEPRSHKDFRASIPEEGLDRKFSRRIDGGFYSRKRYLGGK